MDKKVFIAIVLVFVLILSIFIFINYSSIESVNSQSTNLDDDLMVSIFCYEIGF